MPFDGTNTKGAAAVRVLDGILDLFDEGKYWCTGWGCRSKRNPEGSMCLDHAMRVYRFETQTRGDGAGNYLRKAIREITHHHRTGIWEFNDTRIDFSQIKRVILRAREFAEQDI